MLESTWKRERATFRAEALDLLAVNLSGDDQPFIEAALDDKAQTVRERAAQLLVRIPGTSRAQEAAARAAPLIGKRLGFQVVIRPPDGADGAERATAMTDAISQVPPSHWMAQLGRQPDDLVKTLARDRDWSFAALDGLTRATITFNDAECAAALCPIWLADPPPLGMAAKAHAGSYDATINQHIIALLALMRPGDAERIVANALSGSFDLIRLAAILPQLARPWSVELADRYLRAFRSLTETSLKSAQLNWSVFDAWAASFQSAALAIPTGSVQNAVVLLSQLSELETRQGANYRAFYWKQMLTMNIETLRMRQRIIEEIPG
jgi:hypothetical protein